jgi:hypothetical protein
VISWWPCYGMVFRPCHNTKEPVHGGPGHRACCGMAWRLYHNNGWEPLVAADGPRCARARAAATEQAAPCRQAEGTGTGCRGPAIPFPERGEEIMCARREMFVEPSQGRKRLPTNVRLQRGRVIASPLVGEDEGGGSAVVRASTEQSPLCGLPRAGGPPPFPPPQVGRGSGAPVGARIYWGGICLLIGWRRPEWRAT